MTFDLEEAVQNTWEAVHSRPAAKERCFKKCFKANIFGPVTETQARDTFNDALRNLDDARPYITYFTANNTEAENYAEKADFHLGKAMPLAGIAAATLAGLALMDGDPSVEKYIAGPAAGLLTVASVAGLYYLLKKKE